MTIISASTGPALPLLMRVNEGDDWPIYTGPLGVARLLVQAHGEHVVEVTKYDVKHGAFIARDSQGSDVMEWAITYTNADDALRQALGIHFTRLGYNAVSLGVALRRIALEQITALEAVAPAF